LFLQNRFPGFPVGFTGGFGGLVGLTGGFTGFLHFARQLF